MALPYTVQSKLNYLIESLVLPPADNPDAATLNSLVEELIGIVSPPSFETKATINVGASATLIIPAVLPMRKKFFIHNSGTTNIYVDYIDTVSSTSYFLLIKPSTAIIDEINDQRDVFAISASGTNSVKIRYWS